MNCKSKEYDGPFSSKDIDKSRCLQAIQPKSFVSRTTDSTHGKGYWPNLLLDQPLPKASNLVWPGHAGAVSNVTYPPLIDGEWAHLATWMDWSATAAVFSQGSGLATG